MPLWSCPFGHAPLVMPLWSCPFGHAPLAMPLWSDAPLAMPLWSDAPLAMPLWLCPFGHAPLGHAPLSHAPLNLHHKKRARFGEKNKHTPHQTELLHRRPINYFPSLLRVYIVCEHPLCHY